MSKRAVCGISSVDHIAVEIFEPNACFSFEYFPMKDPGLECLPIASFFFYSYFFLNILLIILCYLYYSSKFEASERK